MSTLHILLPPIGQKILLLIHRFDRSLSIYVIPFANQQLSIIPTVTGETSSYLGLGGWISPYWLCIHLWQRGWDRRCPTGGVRPRQGKTAPPHCIRGSKHIELYLTCCLWTRPWEERTCSSHPSCGTPGITKRMWSRPSWRPWRTWSWSTWTSTSSTGPTPSSELYLHQRLMMTWLTRYPEKTTF